MVLDGWCSIFKLLRELVRARRRRYGVERRGERWISCVLHSSPIFLLALFVLALGTFGKDEPMLTKTPSWMSCFSAGTIRGESDDDRASDDDLEGGQSFSEGMDETSEGVMPSLSLGS
jgi:hypothetical protein